MSVPIYCPHRGCRWSYDSTSLTGQRYLETHLRVVHKGHLDPRMAAPKVDIVADANGRQKAETGSVEPKMEDTRMDTPSREQMLAAFRRYHEENGRWPLPADAKETDYLPSKDAAAKQQGGWPGLWLELGAGKLPMGRAAGNYRKTGQLLVAKPAASSRTSTTAKVKLEVVGPVIGSPAPRATPKPSPSLTFDSLTASVDALRSEMERLNEVSVAAAQKRDAIERIIETIEQLPAAA